MRKYDKPILSMFWGKITLNLDKAHIISAIQIWVRNKIVSDMQSTKYSLSTSNRGRHLKPWLNSPPFKKKNMSEWINEWINSADSFSLTQSFSCTQFSEEVGYKVSVVWNEVSGEFLCLLWNIFFHCIYLQALCPLHNLLLNVLAMLVSDVIIVPICFLSCENSSKFLICWCCFSCFLLLSSVFLLFHIFFLDLAWDGK